MKQIHKYVPISLMNRSKSHRIWISLYLYGEEANCDGTSWASPRRLHSPNKEDKDLSIWAALSQWTWLVYYLTIEITYKSPIIVWVITQKSSANVLIDSSK
ncbi:hypothetical protein PoB_007072600 [Plakobranchus ocellatus]|uniref:Uncharacterized protein n=1 Tax=Plakobranchus ocellatus TaxID=259542 RepID=A0AAV4DK18_9GAST|nr:hypothetical protein PoB_007072600 [Plakobranchus ocellatus]